MSKENLKLIRTITGVDLSVKEHESIEKSYTFFDSLGTLSKKNFNYLIQLGCENQSNFPFSGYFSITDIAQNARSGTLVLVVRMIGFGRKLFLMIIENELKRFFPAGYLEKGRNFIISDLLICYVRRTKSLVFLVHQPTRCKS